MKTWGWASMAAAAILITLSGNPVRAQAPCNERFLLINKTDHIITEFRASNHNAQRYLDNMIPEGNGLFPNHQIWVNPYDGTSAIFYDFKVGFDNGAVIYKNNVNVCNLTTYTIYP